MLLFTLDTQTNGKRLFTPFPRLLKREKGNFTLYHVPGLVSAFSNFRGLAAAMLDSLARSRDRTLSSVYALHMLSRYIPRSFTASGWLVPVFVSLLLCGYIISN